MHANQLPVLVVMVGVPGSGKTSFVKSRFLPTQRLSLDLLRGQLTDDETSQDANHLIVPIQEQILAGRCEMGRITVSDSTNYLPERRDALLKIAGRYGVPAVAVVLETPIAVCLERNAARPNPVPDSVIWSMYTKMRDSMPGIGALPGFAVTRRIGPGFDVVDGELPAQYTDQPWCR